MNNKKFKNNLNWKSFRQRKRTPDAATGSSGLRRSCSNAQNHTKKDCFPRPRNEERFQGQYLYFKTDLIGTGTTAKVFRGLDLNSVRKVALKVFFKQSIHEGLPSQILKKEAQLMQRLRHPNIVRFYDFVQTEAKDYIVMEYSARGTLFDKIYSRRRFRKHSQRHCEPEKKAGPREFLCESQVFRYFLQVCLAVEHLHSRGVIHRDIKPENVLFFAKGLLKMSDFGSAFDLKLNMEQRLEPENWKHAFSPNFKKESNNPKETCDSRVDSPRNVSCNLFSGSKHKNSVSLDEQCESADQTKPCTRSSFSDRFRFSEEFINELVKKHKIKRQTFCGTLDYMSPELLLGQSYDYKVDLWGLGVLLYEMLHKKTPFDGETQMETIENILAFNIKFGRHISEECVKLILGLLNQDPAHRCSLDDIFKHEWMKIYIKKFGLNLDR